MATIACIIQLLYSSDSPANLAETPPKSLIFWQNSISDTTKPFRTLFDRTEDSCLPCHRLIR